MKKALCLILTAALLLGVCIPAYAADAAAQSFSDVPAHAWYADAVNWAVAQGVTKGTGADTFSPAQTCTRAQIVTFLYRAAGSPEVAARTDAAFSDVPDGAYYAAAVRWALTEGITVGTGEDTFSPNAACTRAQIVTFLYRAAGSPAVSAEYSGRFADVPAGAYYAAAVQWAVGQGVTKGTGADRFSPNKTCTRAEAVTFLYRSTGELPEQPPAGRHILVAYFSATGNTRPLAETVAKLLDADLYEIVPAEPYTEEDLAYYTDCRADREQADAACRPAIGSEPPDISRYDTVVIGHPIWHGQAPRIISTFLESCDFSGKTLTSFCTSHSSPLGTSAENLKKLLSADVRWLASRRFAAGTGAQPLADWLTEIGLLPPEQGD